MVAGLLSQAPREADSSRWVLAALSDFNGQLQARDIIRFLRDATHSVGKEVYSDRILMPLDIRGAVQKSSKEKLDEVAQEVSVLDPVFEKLRNVPKHEKLLPFTRETISLNAQEESLMIQHGFLAKDGDRYYLTEIIRHALGYSYVGGARPKVLSLLLRQ